MLVSSYIIFALFIVYISGDVATKKGVNKQEDPASIADSGHEKASVNTSATCTLTGVSQVSHVSIPD